jgi:hypothetical protein
VRRVVLVVASQPQQLDEWQRAVRAVGGLPLPAPTLTRARALLAKVRPHLVLCAAQLEDGQATDLVQVVRAVEQFAHVPVAVLGARDRKEHLALNASRLIVQDEPAPAVAWQRASDGGRRAYVDVGTGRSPCCNSSWEAFSRRAGRLGAGA